MILYLHPSSCKAVMSSGSSSSMAVRPKRRSGSTSEASDDFPQNGIFCGGGREAEIRCKKRPVDSVALHGRVRDSGGDRNHPSIYRSTQTQLTLPNKVAWVQVCGGGGDLVGPVERR